MLIKITSTKLCDSIFFVGLHYFNERNVDIGRFSGRDRNIT